MTSTEMVITVAIVVAGTLLTRFGAFLVFPPGKKAPDFVQYLGKALPAAVMGMLVVYTFKDTVVLTMQLIQEVRKDILELQYL